MTEPAPRSARYVANGDGTVTLRVPCQGTVTNHLDEVIPCPHERRYQLTGDQIDAYIAGAPLIDVWPDGLPDDYVADPRCDDHTPTEGPGA